MQSCLTTLARFLYLTPRYAHESAITATPIKLPIKKFPKAAARKMQAQTEKVFYRTLLDMELMLQELSALVLIENLVLELLLMLLFFPLEYQMKKEALI